MSEETHKPARVNSSGLLAGGGVLSGLFAFLGASCCILPILLVNLGLGSAIVGNLAVFARFRSWFLVAALALTIASAVIAHRGGRRPRPGFWISAGAALVFVAAARMLPHYEGALLQWLNPR